MLEQFFQASSSNSVEHIVLLLIEGAAAAPSGPCATDCSQAVKLNPLVGPGLPWSCPTILASAARIVGHDHRIMQSTAGAYEPLTQAA